MIRANDTCCVLKYFVLGLWLDVSNFLCYHAYLELLYMLFVLGARRHSRVTTEAVRPHHPHTAALLTQKMDCNHS